MAPGTLAGGLQKIAPLFAPIDQALLQKLRSQTHWHADETRWAMFVLIEGKVGYRWYLWVFHSKEVVHYVLDPSRATRVVIDEFEGAQGGILSCDRYSGYKGFARRIKGFTLAFCWAHQRRDFLDLANAYPLNLNWAFEWIDAIGRCTTSMHCACKPVLTVLSARARKRPWSWRCSACLIDVMHSWPNPNWPSLASKF